MYRPLQFLARQVIFPTIVTSGLQKVLWSDNDKILVLMYHGVNSSGDTYINGRHISAKRFEKHLQYFKKNFQVLTLTEAFNSVGTPNSGKPRITITFDDGFENNLIYAAPLLKKYGLPATFYVSSVCASEETDILWPDVIDLVIQNQTMIETNGQTFHRSPKGFFNDQLGQTLQEYIKAQDREERDAIITELSETYHLHSKKQIVNSEFWKLMTAAQVKQLSDYANLEIGSHCHNHYNLANLSAENAKHELELSKKLLEDCIGREVRSIAFPDGSYKKRDKDFAYELGYSELCAVTYKVSEDVNDPRILKRSAVSSTTNYFSNVVHFHKHFGKDGN